MYLSIISFTEQGMRLAKRIAEGFNDRKVELFTKCSAAKGRGMESSVQFLEQNIGDWARDQMQEKNILLFIGACGIAVRAIAPCITDKLHDSPVLVMDEKGEYVIPILSGHLGGANELAIQISSRTGATPVITTATDIHGKFAVDLFAKRNGLYIVNKDGIARISSKVLAGKEITMSIETGHINETEKVPEGVRIIPYPPAEFADVVITAGENAFDTLLCLEPKEYVIGIGCRKGKETEKIETLICRSLEMEGISKNQIFAIASIDRKKGEEGILAWSRKEKIPFFTYSARQLQELEGDFMTSTFVREQVGVDNVCERAAIKACEGAGKLISTKHAEDGMTIAIARREWRVVFDEE